MNATENKPERKISIDAFRAITMLLMIFVNDEGTLVNIPKWLEHADANADAMGFADIIFPAFLFIVGLSVPFAIQSRLKKGEKKSVITKHVLLRSFSLLVIGFFQVNIGNYSKAAFLPKPYWTLLLNAAIFLIWLDYSKYNSNIHKVLRPIGVVLLCVLAIIYVGDSPGGHVWMDPKWWGILGLIGWTYLITSMVFLISNGRLSVQLIALLFFLAFNSATQLGWFYNAKSTSYIWLVGDGSMPTLTTAGVVFSLLYQKVNKQYLRFWIITGITAVVGVAFGLLTRPLWGISKIRATPSWVTICIAISVAAFALLIYLTEIKGYKKWYNIIKPAGTSTLTCYMLPSIHYAFLQLIHIRLPIFLRTGIIGLGKSMLYALAIISIVRLLELARLRLRL